MENLTKLHKVLVRDGYMDLSFEDFIAKSADTDYQERVYEVVTRDGLYEGSRPDFNEQYFAELEVKKKTVPSLLWTWKVRNPLPIVRASLGLRILPLNLISLKPGVEIGGNDQM